MREHVSSFHSSTSLAPRRPTGAKRFVERLRAWWGSPPGRRAKRPVEAAPTDEDSSTRLQSVLSNPVVRERLRRYLSQRCGRANVDFLIGYWTFKQSSNALERFQQLQFMVHMFVREGAERPIDLKTLTRRNLLQDWDKWRKGTRVPPEAKLRGLVAAAKEIERTALARSTLVPQRGR